MADVTVPTPVPLVLSMDTQTLWTLLKSTLHWPARLLLPLDAENRCCFWERPMAGLLLLSLSCDFFLRPRKILQGVGRVKWGSVNETQGHSINQQLTTHIYISIIYLRLPKREQNGTLQDLGPSMTVRIGLLAPLTHFRVSYLAVNKSARNSDGTLMEKGTQEDVSSSILLQLSMYLCTCFMTSQCIKVSQP